MYLLKFICEECKHKVNKINSFKDIFLIKTGKPITCKHCQSKYKVPKPIEKIGAFYDYVFFGGLFAIIWLFLSVAVDEVINKDLGIWSWVVAAVIYVCLEAVTAIILPLKKDIL